MVNGLGRTASAGISASVVCALTWLFGNEVSGQQVTTTVRVHDAEIPEWSAGEPLLSIGDGPLPEEQFQNVAAVLLIEDSRVIVVDGASREVRTFRLDGSPFTRFGGAGDGPGEFPSQPRGAWVAGDTIAVVDASRREHVFRLDGTFVRRSQPLVSPSGTRMRRLGQFAGGGRLARYPDPPSPRSTGRQTVPFHLVRIDDDSRRELAVVPGYIVTPPERGRTQPLVYSPRSQVAVLNDGFCTVFPAEFSFQCYSAEGDAVRTITALDAEARPVTDADKKAFFDGIERANPGPSAYVDRVRRTSVFASTVPVLGRLVTSSDNDIWVGPYLVSEETLGTFNPSPEAPTAWTVLSASGTVKARVTLPARFRLMAVRGRLVAGTWRDPLDVEHILVLPLTDQSVQ